MKTILFIFCLFLCMSCTSQTTSKPSQVQKENIQNINSVPKRQQNKPVIYIFENDTIKQKVELGLFNDKELNFTLTTENKAQKKKAILKGLAKIKNGDVELDEDSEGNAYPVDEYIYDFECWIAFRIERGSHLRMIIKEADCKQHDYSCPFASEGILVKQ